MAARSSSRAFTLLEMLVVIGIIGILIAITLVVGNVVTSGARQRLTLDTIRVLDTTVESYLKTKGDMPDPWIAEKVLPGRSTTSTKAIPVADARNMSDMDSALTPGGNQMINSVGLFIFQAQQVPEAKAALSNLSPKVTRQSSFKIGGTDLTLTTVFDAWGQPIRYVHPAFQGAWSGNRAIVGAGPNPVMPTTVDATQFPGLAGAPTGTTWLPILMRRNNMATSAMPTTAQDHADSDGGRCTGGRPYFYSSGPDGDPSTTADNIYSTLPAFQ